MNHQEIGNLSDLFADNKRTINYPQYKQDSTNQHPILNDNERTSANPTTLQPQPPLHEVLREIANVFKEATVEIAATTRPPARETNLLENDLDKLIRQMHTMTEKLTFALSAHNEPPVPCQRPSYQNSDSSQLTCYACGELGHISRNCTSGRNGGRNQNPPRNLGGQNPAQPRPPVQDFHRPGNGNYCGLDEDRTFQKTKKPSEERLRANLPVVEIPVPVPAQENEYSLPVVEKTPPPRIRRKREPSANVAVPRPMTETCESVETTSTTASTSSTTPQTNEDPCLDENRLYVQYGNKVTKILISCDGENPPMDLEDAEDEGTFDEFEFKDELLEEAEGFFIGKISGIELFENPWEDCNSPATYLAHVEELLSIEPKPEEESVEVKLEKSM
ncbi:5511_t:CDS:2 [Cetraspora pellucida]|uniref:5511_t:CDS:1 n=1 Tax=Cetraspora pellucida TaxID=1433469 RepID=A0ACA9KXK7_9GLOM|nr:5511_t:CDS:2 [Cetraspora pellucida]